MTTSQWPKLFACAALITLAGAIIACSGGDDGPTPTPVETTVSDPSLALSNALRTMKGLNSYVMDIAYSPVGSPEAFLVVYDNGDYFERIPADLSKGGGSEYVYSGDYQYQHYCTAPDVCNQWTRTSPRPLIPSLAGKVNSIPETLALTAAETGSDWTLVPNATGVVITGSVNINLATVENQRRALLASGKTAEEVDTLLKQLSENVQPLGTSVIEITLSPSYQVIQNVTIYTPTNAADPYFEVAFSQFNGVGVTAPADFVPG